MIIKFNCRHVIFCSLLLAVVTACSVPGSDETGSNGILHLKAVEELRIGQMEGDEEYVFGAINYIAIGTDDQIFVSDWQIPIVRMYDSDGTFLRKIGREGRGPGEYSVIMGLKTFQDGRVAVWDIGNLRVVIFNGDGDFLNVFPVEVSLHSADVFETDTDGHIYVRNRTDPDPTLPNWILGWQKYNSRGELTDTLHIPPDPTVHPQTFVLFTASGNAYPFISRPMSALSPLGYLITGTNNEYTITLHKPDGDLIIKRDFEPVTVTDGEKEQWKKWIDYYNVSHSVPDIKPVFKKIMTDMQGRIWVWRYVDAVYTEENIGPHYGPESKWWEPPIFDVFNPDGSYYARVELPFEANFHEAKDNQVWALVKGEFDELYVVRYQLVEEE